MRYVAVIVALFAVALTASPALARDHHPWGGGWHSSRAPFAYGHRQSFDRFLPQIRARHPGRLLDVQPGWGTNGEPHNHIKWLTPDGRVIWLDQDARTGELHGDGGPPPTPYDW